MPLEPDTPEKPIDAAPEPLERNLGNAVRVVLPFLQPGARIRLILITATSFISGLAQALIVVLIVNTALGIVDQKSANIGLPLIGALKLSVPQSVGLGLALCVFQLSLDLSGVQMGARIGADTYAGMRIRAHRAFLRSTWDVQAKSGEGQLQDLVSTYAPQESNAVQLISNGLIALTSFLSLLLAAFLLNAGAAALVIVAVGVLFVCFRPLGKRIHTHSQSQLRENAIYVGEISQGVRLAQAIHAFDVGEVWVQRDDHYALDTAHYNRLKLRLRNAISPLYQFVALCLMLISLGGLYATSKSQLGSLGALILILLRAVNSGQSIQGVYQALLENMPFATHLSAEIERLEEARQPRGTEPLDRINTLGMEGVTYSYVADQPALQDVTFEFKRGESIGIVGPSGGGKSTLVQLLLRLRTPDQGMVTANGQDALPLSLDDWYRHIAFVPQEPLLTSGSIRENIEFFRADIQPGAVERAAEQAHIHHDIVTWADGYETTAGARGGGLSGGQKQRLCIARALVTNPEIIILDEPTSALDVNAETIVRDTLEALHGETTIILVAHRLSTLRLCDKIMVIDGGRITAFEPTSDLANREGFYREALATSDRHESNAEPEAEIAPEAEAEAT